MEQVYQRMCSADQANVLADAAGKFASVGASKVRIQHPVGWSKVIPENSKRYLARVAIVESEANSDSVADEHATEVVSALFGPYLA
jgi:hypothetical protein